LRFVFDQPKLEPLGPKQCLSLLLLNQNLGVVVALKEEREGSIRFCEATASLLLLSLQLPDRRREIIL